MMAHLLSTIPYREVALPQVELPDQPVAGDGYQRPDRGNYRYVEDYAATLPAATTGGA